MNIQTTAATDTSVAAAAVASKTVATATEANGLDVIQSMIDISADRLEGLRTQCATSASLTQQEIRSLETKLIRMFSELLLTKARLQERIPSNGLATSGAELKQWLRVVGLSSETFNVCLQRLNTLEQLLEKSDDELKELLSNNPNFRDEELRRITTAIQNLRKCRDALLNGNKNPEDLFWDSWDRHHHSYSHHHHHHRGVGVTAKPNIESGGGNTTGSAIISASPRSHRVAKHAHRARQSPVEHTTVQSPVASTMPDDGTHGSLHTLTPSPSPPNSPCLTNLSSSSGGTSTKLGHRKSGTPPPKKKHQTLLPHHPPTPSHSGTIGSGSSGCVAIGSQQDPLSPLTKSKSHESQLMQDNPLQNVALTNSYHSQQQQQQQQQYQQQPAPQIIPRTRLHTEPCPDLPSHLQYNPDMVIENTNNLTVPRSPCTPIVSLGMGHMIAHRFTKVFKMMSTCDLCQKQMFFGLKCKECKYRCHKDCEPNVPPSCGLPPEFVDEFKKTLHSSEVFIPNSSPQLGGRSTFLTTARRQKSSATTYHAPDSSSPGSSCNSSSPSSPALFGTNFGSSHMHSQQYSNQNSQHVATPSSAHKQSIQFNFPDVSINTSGGNQQGQHQHQQQQQQHHYHHHHQHSHQHQHQTQQQQQQHQLQNPIHVVISDSPAQATNINISSSNCSSIYLGSTLGSISGTSVSGNTITSSTSSTTSGNGRTGNGSGFRNPKLSSSAHMRPPLSELSDTHRSNDSDKTVSLSGSTSASTDSDRTPIRLDSTEDGDSGNWPRQNSLSLKEWDIPYDDLHLLEKIGKGRFGTVHRALWHGDVAVKLLKEDYLDDERTLEAFKLEVATFKKTRHENLVLFMGACMNPPFLAIVTSLCKGNTLYTYIHMRRDKFNLNRSTLVAQQISQGMGYLHARGINHKDLRTKNIFLENGKVIITDFGLFSSTKLLYCDLGLGIPNGWLCYLGPELMRALTPYRPTDEILPFSRASDVYAFGTVWYELLCGEFPYKLQPPESVIWQVGRGMKQTLANLQTSRDVKDILMMCWSFQADDRPDFAKLLGLLERLPKKRLARSPSHPAQLSRSAESVF